MNNYELGQFRLDTYSGMLLRGAEPVVLGGRAVALLRALVERPGALVSKDSLIEAAWPGQVVEDSNLPVQIAALRRALGEAPGGDRWIETMPRRGYRFVGPVVLGGKDSVVATPPQLDAPRDAEPIRDDEAERRQITALSCELVGVGAGADGTGFEDLREPAGALQQSSRPSWHGRVIVGTASAATLVIVPCMVALAGVEFLLPSGEAGGASNRLHNLGHHDANYRDLSAARRTAFFDRRAAFC
jgi:DNA-binding winged helix-turn-helix (wHTH) protein